MNSQSATGRKQYPVWKMHKKCEQELLWFESEMSPADSRVWASGSPADEADLVKEVHWSMAFEG